MTRNIITCLFFLSIIFQAFAQEQIPKQDSVESVSNQSNELIKMLVQQQQDSLKRIELENRFINQRVKTSKEYQDLYNEINYLKNKDSLMRVRRLQKVDSLKSLNQGVPVQPFDSTLFRIYTNGGSYSAA